MSRAVAFLVFIAWIGFCFELGNTHLKGGGNPFYPLIGVFIEPFHLGREAFLWMHERRQERAADQEEPR